MLIAKIVSTVWKTEHTVLSTSTLKKCAVALAFPSRGVLKPSSLTPSPSGTIGHEERALVTASGTSQAWQQPAAIVSQISFT